MSPSNAAQGRWARWTGAALLSDRSTGLRLTYWLLAGSTLVGSCAVAYVWWVLGAQIDADDSFTQPPAAAGYGGIGLVVTGVSIVVFVASAAAGFARRPH